MNPWGPGLWKTFAKWYTLKRWNDTDRANQRRKFIKPPRQCWDRAPKGATRCSLWTGHTGDHIAYLDNQIGGEILLSWPHRSGLD